MGLLKAKTKTDDVNLRRILGYKLLTSKFILIQRYFFRVVQYLESLTILR